jgi:hypothetical protein
MLQIPSAGDDPITRTAALMALICAMISLLFGCIYVVRFGTMKRTHQALSWAEVCNPHVFLFGLEMMYDCSPGSEENQQINILERLGAPGDACCLVILVGSK